MTRRTRSDPAQGVDFWPFWGVRLAFFALKNQFVLCSFFGTFVDSKGLIEFVRSILVSFSVFKAFSASPRSISNPFPSPPASIPLYHSNRLAKPLAIVKSAEVRRGPCSFPHGQESTLGGPMPSDARLINYPLLLPHCYSRSLPFCEMGRFCPKMFRSQVFGTWFCCAVYSSSGLSG